MWRPTVDGEKREVFGWRLDLTSAIVGFTVMTDVQDDDGSGGGSIAVAPQHHDDTHRKKKKGRTKRLEADNGRWVGFRSGS